MSSEVLSEAPLKPLSDAREYRLVQLTNGLRALIIHDASITAPERVRKRETSCCSLLPIRFKSLLDDEECDETCGSKMAACALCLGVGSLCDPRELQGLAHYVEHMVFMGTTAHPQENGWGKWLSQHGGQDNGETNSETTTFYFDVHPNHLQPALRRFVGFFVDPLFKWSGSRSEVKVWFPALACSPLHVA